MKKTIFVGMISGLLLLSAIVYAHGTSDENAGQEWNGMINVDEMNEMHEIMTQGLSPELKQQIDIMHEGCISSFSRERNANQEMMNSAVQASNSMRIPIMSMMGMGSMMG